MIQRIAGVLARSNPYGIITGNYKENRYDVLAREKLFALVT